MTARLSPFLFRLNGGVKKLSSKATKELRSETPLLKQKGN